MHISTGLRSVWWRRKRPACNCSPVSDVLGWTIDSASMAEIDPILIETIKDLIGPDFMATPDRVTPRSEVATARASFL